MKPLQIINIVLALWMVIALTLFAARKLHTYVFWGSALAIGIWAFWGMKQVQQHS